MATVNAHEYHHAETHAHSHLYSCSLSPLPWSRVEWKEQTPTHSQPPVDRSYASMNLKDKWAIARNNEVVCHAVPWPRQAQRLRTASSSWKSAIIKNPRSGPTNKSAGFSSRSSPIPKGKKGKDKCHEDNKSYYPYEINDELTNKDNHLHASAKYMSL